MRIPFTVAVSQPRHAHGPFYMELRQGSDVVEGRELSQGFTDDDARTLVMVMGNCHGVPGEDRGAMVALMLAARDTWERSVAAASAPGGLYLGHADGANGAETMAHV